MPKKPRVKFTDQTPMPWGKHKGTPMEEVPASHLLWLFKQPWIKEWPDLYDYLVENQVALLQEDEEAQDTRPSGKGFESLDDYMRYGR
jgi:hypothetical protein